MFTKEKYFRLGEVDENLCKQVMELESEMMTNTPTEVQEEKKKETTEAVQKMEYAEVLWAKGVKHVLSVMA